MSTKIFLDVKEKLKLSSTKFYFQYLQNTIQRTLINEVKSGSIKTRLKSGNAELRIVRSHLTSLIEEKEDSIIEI